MTVSTANSEKTAMKLFLFRLIVWQKFMKKHGIKHLSNEAQTGLFAELHFLNEIVINKMNTDDSISSWIGPAGAPQDFKLPGAFVEIKSSTIIPYEKIKISTLKQLDEKNQAIPLILCHTGLNAGDKVDGITLPEMVSIIRNKVSDKDSATQIKFNDKLMDAGYHDVHSKIYENTRYNAAQKRYFLVQKNFPRICTSEVREGVLSGSYNIAFSACLPFEINQFQALNLIFGEED